MNCTGCGSRLVNEQLGRCPNCGETVSPGWRRRSSTSAWVVVPCVVLAAVAIPFIKPLLGREEGRAAPVSPSSQATQERAINRIGQEAVLAVLKDPGSATFRGQFRGKSGVACGEVNSKNSFGGYSGFQRYMASGGGVVFLEDQVARSEFEGAWSQMCK